MKKLLLIIILLLLSAGCRIQQIPVKEETIYHYIDSTLYHIDTISVEIPKEIIKEVLLADSSHLETSVAISDAWVDSLSMLHHQLQNKGTLEKEILWKERIVYKDSVVRQDVIVEVPVETRYVPRFYKFCLAWLILSALGIAAYIFLKFKK